MGCHFVWVCLIVAWFQFDLFEWFSPGIVFTSWYKIYAHIFTAAMTDERMAAGKGQFAFSVVASQFVWAHLLGQRSQAAEGK